MCMCVCMSIAITGYAHTATVSSSREGMAVSSRNQYITAQ